MSTETRNAGVTLATGLVPYDIGAAFDDYMKRAAPTVARANQSSTVNAVVRGIPQRAGYYPT